MFTHNQGPLHMIKGFHFFETMVPGTFALFSPYTTTATKVKTFFELWPASFEISLYPQILLGGLSINHKHDIPWIYILYFRIRDVLGAGHGSLFMQWCLRSAGCRERSRRCAPVVTFKSQTEVGSCFGQGYRLSKWSKFVLDAASEEIRTAVHTTHKPINARSMVYAGDNIPLRILGQPQCQFK